MTTLTAKYQFRSRLLVLVAVILLGVSSVAAIPLREYHELYEHIISDVESLLEKEESETDEAFELRYYGTIDAMRSELPKTQQVEDENAKWNTDNAWFHTALDELQNIAIEERPVKLASLLESLRAVDGRVNDLEDAQTVNDDKAAAKGKMENILARPEYVSGPRGPNALTRMINDFMRWLRSLLPDAPTIAPGRANFLSGIVQLLVVLAALAVILYVARLLFIRFRRPLRTRVRKKREARIVLGERIQPEATPIDLLAEAEALARNGDVRAAIRKGYIALLVELGDRKVISLAQYKTNRDYLRSVSNVPQLHSPLKTLTESFERHWYGFAQATPNDWQDFRAGYREALQTGN